MRNDNYIHVSGWMVNELKLKGTELLVYALIYGFSQDGESEFHGSLGYICGWLNISKPTAIKALSTLVADGKISKREIEVARGIKVCCYSANFTGGKETLPGVKKLKQGGKETLPNNNNINTNNNIYKGARPTLDEVKAYCSERGKGVDPEKWFDFYSSNGWKVGRNPMRDWKAAVRTWERNGYSKPEKPKQKPNSNNRFNNFEQRSYDTDVMNKLMGL